MELSVEERVVLTTLQRGIALEVRPFRGLRLPENEVVDLLTRGVVHGFIRRFGGIFDSRGLGYASMLCAVDARTEQMDAVAATVCRHPGVTHCYARQPLFLDDHGYPGLWFTIAMQKNQFVEGMDALQQSLGGANVITLPALRRFKIDVVFDLNRKVDGNESGRDIDADAAVDRRSSVEIPTDVGTTSLDREMVRRVGGALPITARPFDVIADELGIGVDVLLGKLRDWQDRGVLRRIAPILHHRHAGFAFNGMCVWPVESDIVAAGECLASHPEVTHCYQRPRTHAFPFDLYAMIHAQSREALIGLFEHLSDACQLNSGKVLVSTREYKKSSMSYFRADEC